MPRHPRGLAGAAALLAACLVLAAWECFPRGRRAGGYALLAAKGEGWGEEGGGGSAAGQRIEALHDVTVGSQVDRQAKKILARAEQEKAIASKEGIKGAAFDQKADRICKMAQHLQDTDDGEAQRARLQKEAATSLEGRAAVLVGEAAREMETYKQIYRKGVVLRASGRKMLETGTKLLQHAGRLNVTLPENAKQHNTLISNGHQSEDHGGRLLARAHIVLKRGREHRTNAAVIREQAQKTSDAAKAAMELGQRFAREAVAHRLKAMTYRSRCTMMRAKAQAALRRARDEAKNAKDLSNIADPAAGKQVGGQQSLLETFASSGGLGGWGGRMHAVGGEYYDEHEERVESRMERRDSTVRKAFDRVLRREEREEKRISALRSNIDRDRSNYAVARDVRKSAEKKMSFAEGEMRQVGVLKGTERATKERLSGQKKVTERLRQKVASLIAVARRRKNEKAEEAKRRMRVEKTLQDVDLHANKERAQAMKLERAAQNEIGESHQMALRASRLEDVASQLDQTADLDMKAAAAALLEGREQAKVRLEAAHAPPPGGVPGGRGRIAGTAASGDEAVDEAAEHAEQEMKSKEAQARQLREEARSYQHAATQLEIQAEVKGAKAPTDLAAAQRELSASDVLRKHVADMQKTVEEDGGSSSDSDAWRQQRWQQARESGSGERKVGVLAAYMSKLQRDGSSAKEAKYAVVEMRTKAKADLQAAQGDMRQAKSQVEAARESEDEDEARVRALERQLRINRQEQDTLRARLHA